MKNTFTKIFTIFAIIIYLFTLSFLVYNLTFEYKTGDNRTYQQFSHCTVEIKNIFQKNQNYSPSALENQLNPVFGDFKDFAKVEVKQNNKTIYKYSPSSSDNSDSKLLRTYTNSFIIGETNYTFTATLYKLKPYSIYYHINISFLTVLIVTIITVILIIWSNINHSTPNKINTEEKNLEAEEHKIDSIKESIPEETEKQEVTNIENSDNTSDNSSNQETTSEDSVSTEENQETVEQAEPVKLPTDDIKPVPIDETPAPEGLFSPDSGLGWEAYLLTRLDSELNRAISQEFDLSLFNIKITNLSRKSDTVKKICEYLITAFQFKDLLFEYKEDSIVAIKINMNIDEAITFAGNLYEAIKSILSDSFATCSIGISSRTLRMISGERLLNETNEALAHAEQQKDYPIMGFRADAEKFRKFFENQ